MKLLMNLPRLMGRNYFCQVKPALNIESVLKKYGRELEESKMMEKMIPRHFTEDKLEQLSENQRFSGKQNHLNSLDMALSEPIWDLLDRGGKRWRPVLAMLIAELFGRQRSQVLEIAALCEVIHNGSLIVDDIEDSSDLRRNKPCVHKIYGVDIAINAGNFMCYVPMQYIFKSNVYTSSQKLEFAKIYFEEMVQIHFGQGWDILWHNNNKIEGDYPTVEQYLQMTAHKTGVLPRLVTRLVGAFIGVPQSQMDVLARFAQKMGVAFQIQDDLLNLQGDSFKLAKGYSGEDIHEGKITLMVINHIQKTNGFERERLLEILKMKTLDEKLIQQAINLLKKSGSLDYAKVLMEKLIDQSKESLDKHFPFSEHRQLLKQLADFGIKRQK